MSKLIDLVGLSEFLKKCKETFVTKKDKYIIIDWEGKDATDAAKKAEVDAQLKNIFLANPLSLLSVVFMDYAADGEINRVSAFFDDGSTVFYSFVFGDEITQISFDYAE